MVKVKRLIEILKTFEPELEVVVELSWLRQYPTRRYPDEEVKEGEIGMVALYNNGKEDVVFLECKGQDEV